MCTKRLLLSAVITCFIFLSASSQTLFTYGTKTATKEEFLKAYNKNPDTTGNQSQKLKEYLDMYINFRLKLQAAYDEKLNTNETLQAEAENFKAQLAENIINEQADLSQLLHEAFLRSQKDIKLAQVFVAVPAGSDTADAYAQIKRAYADLNTSKSFEEVTVAYSTDTSVIAAKGNIGYITVFTLPYQIENIVYGLQPGKYSNIYRSGIGYHIFKNVQERAATGKRKIQQLMFPTPPFFTDEQKQAVAKETDSVYNLLKQGASFAEMMKTYNREDDNDPNAAIDVSVGQYNSDFEDHVFALQSQGDISMPFTTAYGYNIIKLIEILAVNKNESDVINTAHLQEQIQTDNRLNVAKQKLADKWLTEIKYKPAAYNAEDLWAFTDSMIQGKNLPAGYKGIKSTTVLFQFEKQKITADDWIKFAGMARESEEPYNDASYSDLMKEFVRQSAANYYKQHIEDYYPS
ncbi:MAG: peptidylprolyl isomerase, partial [Parafilimonas sp.]